MTDKGEPKITLNVLTKFIKPYNGDRESLPAFLTNCDSAISFCSVDQQGFLCKYIISQLEGKAQTACSLKTFSSWPELKKFLKSTFGEKKHSSHLLHDLQNCKQTASETVTQYGLRIEACLTRLQADIQFSCEDKVQLPGRIGAMEDLALNTFLLGLSPNLSTIVRCRNPLTLNDAITQAIEEEKLLKLTRVSSYGPKPIKTCSICHKNGHSSSDCYVKKREQQFQKSFVVQPSTSSSGQNNVQFSQTLICAYCKKPGHHINNCRKRQYNNQRRAEPNNTQSPPQVTKEGRVHMCDCEFQGSHDSFSDDDDSKN